ncbi:MAG: transcription termination/antitermination protein NusA, partial [Spirochaetota bacterium]
GLKGIRIQAIIRELEGEKVDILKYEIDSKRFIHNALSPAEVRDVYILDEPKHLALVVVPDSQLSVAIGKQGLNVRLANRLCDWNIDVKTDEQFREMDRSGGYMKAVSELFGEGDAGTLLNDLPGMEEAWVTALESTGIMTVEDVLGLEEGALAAIEGLDEAAATAIHSIIAENVEVVEESDDETIPEGDGSSQEEYQCPDCGAAVTPEMSHCASCGVELSFEYEDDQEA